MLNKKKVLKYKIFIAKHNKNIEFYNALNAKITSLTLLALKNAMANLSL